MPYRTELRRPDLKGTFRCSLCSKIFCHSSSLSRHRMQAHFKSYTCTLCNKEITSNETLRAHMYKKHQISRMFMCRCCNWAFPDKTSLHIHMQAMATGNPGNVSIIAKSSSSPPPGHTPNGGTPTSVNANNNCSPMVSSIFPAMPSREDLINKLREKAMMTGYPSTPGFDLSLLFPNFAKATSTPPATTTERGDGNNNNVTSHHHRRNSNGVAPTADDIDDDMIEEINCEEPEEGMADIEYGGGESLDDASDDGGVGDRKSSLSSPAIHASNLRLKDDQPYVKIKEEPSRSATKFLSVKQEPSPTETAGQTPSPVSMVHQIQSDPGMMMHMPGMPQHQLQMPILRSAISASPLNSLMYQKKLNNVLRNKNNSIDQLLGSFLNPVYHQHHSVAMTTTTTSSPTPLHVTAVPPPSMTSSRHHPYQQQQPSRASPSSLLGNAAAPSNHHHRGSPLTTTHHHHHHRNSDVIDCAIMTSSSIDTSGSHISPTDTTSSNSSAHSSSRRPSSVSPPTVAMATGGAVANSNGGGAACFECKLVKGKLAQAENRCRFLESKTTSQESKISRLENRVSTLEGNNKRYETEAASLRIHCDNLEKKILDCQERALRYLTNNNFDAETTKQILHDVLETCRVYGSCP